MASPVVSRLEDILEAIVTIDTYAAAHDLIGHPVRLPLEPIVRRADLERASLGTLPWTARSRRLRLGAAQEC